MNISDKYIEELPMDPIDACHKVVEDSFVSYRNSPQNSKVIFNNIAPYYAIIRELTANIPEISQVISEPVLSDSHNENLKNIFNYLQNVKRIIDKTIETRSTIADIESISQMREQFRMYNRKEFCYVFSDGDIARIQQLINELRDSIAKSELFDAKHKQRILNKLEGLQSEMHKKMSNLDRFWGLIGEAGIVLGKFGQDAKPLVDRIKEVTQIVWRTQSRAEELPTGTTLPLLTDGKQEN